MENKIMIALFPGLSKTFNSMAPRERKVVVWGGSLLCVALFYAYVWYPVSQERDKLVKSLPELVSRAKRMSDMAVVAVELSRQPEIHTNSDGADLFVGMEIKRDGVNKLIVSSPSTPFDKFISSLAAWQKTTGGHISSCSIEKKAEGLASVSCLLTTQSI